MLPDHRDIFIVENHPDTLRYLCKYLLRRGYEVRQAVDMRQALELFRAEPTSILLSDIGLPDGDGWELLSILKSEGYAPYAVSMSGFGSGHSEQQSQMAGFSAHLLKPFLLDDLEAILQKAPKKE